MNYIAKVLGFYTPICEMISWDSLLCAFTSSLYMNLNHLSTLLTAFGMSSVFGGWMLLDGKLCCQQNDGWVYKSLLNAIIFFLALLRYNWHTTLYKVQGVPKVPL